MASNHFDVIVVGGGPTGLTMANLLAIKHHKVAVFERQGARYGLPRAGHMDHEVWRILQEIGCLEPVLSDAVAKKSNRWLNGKGEVLFEFQHWQQSASSFDSAHVYQPLLEDALHDGLERRRENVTIFQGFQVDQVEQTDIGVRAIARQSQSESESSSQSGTTEVAVTAHYLIAADGARSGIRQWLGIQRDDFGFNERWLDVDVAYRRPCDFGPAAVVADPARPHFFGPLGKTHHRFEWQLFPSESDDEYSTAGAAWALLAKEGVTKEDVSIVRQAVYRFEYCLARTWRAGRVFLMGDAAHTIPPCLGQGMCAGMRDAANLAWKLDLVLRDKVPASILESYEIERKPHIKAWGDMSLGAGKIAFTTDPGTAAERDAKYRNGEAPNWGKTPTLCSGVLDQRGLETTGPVGHLFPQRRIRRRGRAALFDDAAGDGFHLVAVTDPREFISNEDAQYLAHLGTRILWISTRGDEGFVDAEGYYAKYFADENLAAIIVRPDHYVFGGTRTLADLSGLIVRLRHELQKISGGPNC